MSKPIGQLQEASTPVNPEGLAQQTQRVATNPAQEGPNSEANRPPSRVGVSVSNPANPSGNVDTTPSFKPFHRGQS